MIGWILSIAGIGGIGAALFFIPGLLPNLVKAAANIPAKAWAIIAAVAFLLGGVWFCLHLISQRDDARAHAKAERAAHVQTIVNYRTASAKALADAKDNKVRVENRYLEIENHEDQSIRARLASALDRLQRASAANPGSADATGLSGPSGATFDPDRAGQVAIMDDKRICTEAVIKAQGWQSWFDTIKEVPIVGGPE